LDAVGRSEVEVALIEGAPDELEPGLKGQVFQRDELLLVAAPSHPLAQARGPLKLDGLPLVWRERGSGTREVAERALQAAGIQTPVLLELPGTEAVKEALISGLGAAFLSELRVRRELDAGLLVRLDARLPGLRRELRCVAPPENQLSRAARAFVALLTEGQQPWNDSRAG
ncbi:MAG: LysR substrate-binding domain-containing protein, partial [Deinococcus sp.]